MNNKRRNRDEDENSCELAFSVINESPFLLSTFRAVAFLRDPNNKLPITPTLLNTIDTNPEAVLSSIGEFIINTTTTHFGEQLRINVDLFEEEGFGLFLNFKNGNYLTVHEPGISSNRLEAFLDKSLCVHFDVYFRELNSFLTKFANELNAKGKDVTYEFIFTNIAKLGFSFHNEDDMNEDDMEEENLNVPFDQLEFMIANEPFIYQNQLPVSQPISQPRVVRASSPYIIFVTTMREQVKNEYPNASFGELGQIMGQMWASMSDQQKQPYVDQSNDEKRQLGM